MTDSTSPPAAAERLDVPWPTIRNKVASCRNYWLVTAGRSGPHAAPVWGVSLGDAGADVIVFSTAASSVKARNLAEDPRCVIHVDGDDVVILHGEATPLRDAELHGLADARYAAKYVIPGTGEPCHLPDGPDAGTYVFRPRLALTWLEQAFAQTMTRWVFSPGGGSPQPVPISYS